MITVRFNTSGKHNIVGIYSPQPQSGKSTVANYIQRRGFEHHSFAATGKGMLYVLLQQLGYTPDECYAMLNGDDKTLPINGLYHNSRYLMQTMMTDWGRQMIDPAIWIRTLEQRLKVSKNRNVIIDDMRFPNEWHWIKNQGGYTICVLRPNVPSYAHASEGRLNNYKFDMILENVGTLPALTEKCKMAVREIRAHFST